MSPAARRALRHLLVLGLYLLLSVLMTWPLVRQLGSAIPGDSFDGWQNVWNLWWMRESWLLRHASPYFAPILHYPTGVDLRFQTMAPVNGLLTLPIQLTAGLLPAYNAAVLLSFVLGGYGAYLLGLYALRQTQAVNGQATNQASRFTFDAAAFLAGVIFTFSPYHFAHLLGHLQLITLQWIPFYALYLLRSLDRNPPSLTTPRSTPNASPVAIAARRSPLADILKPAIFLILVGLSDWYYVFYCLLFTAFVVLIRLIQRRLTWRSIGLVAGVGLVFGLALASLLMPMVRAAGQWRGAAIVRGVEESITYSADLLAFITPQVFHPLWGPWALARSARFTATPSEYTVFAGFTTLLLCGVALMATRTRKPTLRTDTPAPATDQRRALQEPLPADQDRQSSPASASLSSSPGFYLLSAAFFALLALGPALKIGGRADLLPGGGQIPLPYRLLYETVPFVKLSRSVSRLDVMVMLFLGVAAAFGVVALAHWLKGKGSDWGIARWTAVAAIGLVLFEFWPAPYPVSPPDTPAWYQTLAEDPTPGAVLNLPANYERPWYLLYQTTHRKPLATGYVTRDDPSVLRERAPVLSQFWFLGPDINTQHFDLARQGVQVLHDLLGVRWVVLDRYKMPGGKEREITTAYAQAIFAGQAPLYEDDRITVYAVPEPAQRGPYIVLGADWRPRQSDDAGRVWRDLPSGQPARLEVINPSGVRLRIEVEAAAPAGGRMRLLDAGGGELARWPLEQGSTPITWRSDPLAALSGASTPLQLLYEGPPDSSAAIYSLTAIVEP